MPESEKLTIPQLREIAAKLNGPTELESRQMALTNLFIELCDRVSEITGGAGAAIRRLTEESEHVTHGLRQIQDLVTGVIQPLEQSQQAPEQETTASVTDLVAQAQAEIAAQQAGGLKTSAAPATPAKPAGKNGGAKRPATMPPPVEAPAPVADPGPPLTDPAAIAAQINGAQGVPPAMAIVKQGK